MRSLPFEKYEGTGNDFVLVEAGPQGVVDAALARRLCDRHFGVGADGVLVVSPAEPVEARARMEIFNADGSRAEMCGNGLRCVALHLARADGLTRTRYRVETGAGTLGCEVERDGDVAQVELGMGRAALLGEHHASFDGRSHRLRCISMGNPHAVLFGPAWDEVDIDRFAPGVSDAFPEGSNVEFATVHDEPGIDLVVWERGVGRTLACGTGAAATLVAAAAEGRVPFDQPVPVRLPGGVLSISVQKDTLAVQLRGPARRVFCGEVSGW